MTANEIVLFTKHMSKASNYFEFGCGGSTVLAAKLGVQCITSVDTSKDWIEIVRQNVGPHERLYMEVCFSVVVSAKLSARSS